MLIAFDIGNTNIVIGGFAGEELTFEYRIKSDHQRTADEYAGILLPLLEKEPFDPSRDFSAAIVSSVVPPITPEIVSLLKGRFGLQPMVVGPGIKTGLNIRIPDPKSVGSDRVVNAVAARDLFGTPSLVIDFGTATSFDYVNLEGDYEGGAIAPGLGVSLDSLVKRTAKLPRIEITLPEKVIGNSTVEAMKSGVVLGYLSLVDGLIDRIIAERGPLKHIIATGGLGALLGGHLRHKVDYDPHITLKGLRLIADMNMS